jgi:hypothetical protein
MSHGHSHSGNDKKSKNKKDEDSAENGDAEHLCADERIEIEDNHGHSHGSELVTSNNDAKSKKRKKKGCKKKIFEIKIDKILIYSGWWSNEYSWCFSSCIK